mmetsp:Transcript_14766/g.45642  ORF Transcript_14766/g.45642 Transcript_14766/m.45642 type:complete len:294 (+) Transcript_14766:222-1103(+)
MGCAQCKLWLEQKVAGSITKRTLAKNARPVFKDGEEEPRAAASIFDRWDALLATYLKPAGEPVDGVRFAAMDYKGLAGDPDFKNMLEVIARLDVADVRRWPTNARLALYINSYNALCAEHVCRHIRSGDGVPASVRDCGDGRKEVWDRVAGTVAGEALSLNKIEHGVIRTRWNEPRVHACVNCASRSCPDLLTGAYRGDDRLDDQLSSQFERWLADDSKGLKFEHGKPVLSRIFLWFAGDFTTKDAELCGQDSGLGTPGRFAGQWAPAGEAKEALLAGVAPDYYDYSWNVNAQ